MGDAFFAEYIEKGYLFDLQKGIYRRHRALALESWDAVEDLENFETIWNVFGNTKEEAKKAWEEQKIKKLRDDLIKRAEKLFGKLAEIRISETRYLRVTPKSNVIHNYSVAFLDEKQKHRDEK